MDPASPDGWPGEPSSSDQRAGLALSGAGYDSFVVRVQSRRGERALLRGHVTHIGTRRTAHFATSQGLISFMEAHLGLQPDPRSATP